ncbi:hypothetical protein OC835_001065 [Tilletia horrida]|nr:hypothetical protein OC835_001065 [Tilletia horrida]
MAAPIYDSVVLLGDSQTEFGSKPGGLVNLLAAHYSRVFDVVNRGFSGYTTDQARVLAPRIFAQQRVSGAAGLGSPPSGTVRLVTVWFGSNDAAVPGHRQHVPLSRFRENLSAILDTIEARAPAAKILCLTPVTLIPETERVGESRQPAITRTYVDAILEVAQARRSSRIVGVDLYSMFEEVASRHLGAMQPLLQEDGLHISDFGYKLIFHKLTGIINGQWPELDPRRLQATYPLWRDVLPEEGKAAVSLEPRANVLQA